MSYMTPLKDYSSASFNTPTEDTFLQAKRRIRFTAPSASASASASDPHLQTATKNINDIDESFLSNKISNISSNYTQNMKPLISSPFKPSPRASNNSPNPNGTFNNTLISSTPLHRQFNGDISANNASPNSSDVIYHSLTSAYGNGRGNNSSILNGSFSKSGPTGTPFFRPAGSINHNQQQLQEEQQRGFLESNSKNNNAFSQSRHTSPLRQVHHLNDSYSQNSTFIGNNQSFNSTPLANSNNINSNSLQRSIFSKSRRPTLTNQPKPNLQQQNQQQQINGNVPTEPINSSFKVEDATVDLQSPYVEIAISRIVHKDAELKRLLNNLLFVLFFKFLGSLLLLILVDIDLTNLWPITIDPYFDKLMEGGKYFKHLVYCIFIYNIMSSFFKLIKPQDQCLDLPLTNKQRKLLGLQMITSKEQDNDDEFSSMPPPQIKSNTNNSGTSEKSIFNQSPRSPTKNSQLPDVSLLASDINRSFASLNLKSGTDQDSIQRQRLRNNNNSINNSSFLLPSSPDKSAIIKEKLLNGSPSLNGRRFANGSNADVSFSPSNRFLYTVSSPNHKASGFIRNGFDATNSGDVSFY